MKISTSRLIFFEAMQELMMKAGNCLQRSPVGRIFSFKKNLIYHAFSIRESCETRVSQRQFGLQPWTPSSGQASLPQVDAALLPTAVRGPERSRAPVRSLGIAVQGADWLRAAAVPEASPPPPALRRALPHSTTRPPPASLQLTWSRRHKSSPRGMEAAAAAAAQFARGGNSPLLLSPPQLPQPTLSLILPWIIAP